MNKTLILLITFVISGCASMSGLKDSESRVFYDRKAALEIQCKSEAHSLYPGYPTKKGVLTNYMFTRAYDHCLKNNASNNKNIGSIWIMKTDRS